MKQRKHSIINKVYIYLRLTHLPSQTGHCKHNEHGQCIAQLLSLTPGLFLSPQRILPELRTNHSDQRATSCNSDTPAVKTDVYTSFSPLDQVCICTRDSILLFIFSFVYTFAMPSHSPKIPLNCLWTIQIKGESSCCSQTNGLQET